MTGKRLAVIAAGALVAGGSGIAIAQRGTGRQGAHQVELRAAEARSLLVRDGYRQYADFIPDGKNFTADVLKNGRVFEVLIVVSTGQVQPQVTAPHGM